jgi:hypothetical protein
MDKFRSIKYTKRKSSNFNNREVVEMTAVQQVAETSKILAKPKNAMELRAIVSQKPAYGVNLVDQHKQGRK